MNSPKYIYTGATLIAIGVAILLDRSGIFNIPWSPVFWFAMAFAGAGLVLSGFARSRGNRIFFGTLIALWGAYHALSMLGVFWFDPGVLIGYAIASFGVAVLMVFCSSPRRLSLLVLGSATAALGSAIVLAELGHLSRWEVISFVGDYWPLVLVAFGLAIMMHRPKVSRGKV